MYVQHKYEGEQARNPFVPQGRIRHIVRFPHISVLWSREKNYEVLFTDEFQERGGVFLWCFVRPHPLITSQSFKDGLMVHM